MTSLEGERVLTLMDDLTSVLMYGKRDRIGQLWRIESNGCLRNKEIGAIGRCLTIDGSHAHKDHVYMDWYNGQDNQHWEFTIDHYIMSKLRGDGIIFNHLVLDVIWSDSQPLVTNGAQVHAIKKDFTASQKWKMKPCRGIFCATPTENNPLELNSID